MKTCTYKLGEKTFSSEADLDNYIINNYDNILKMVSNKDMLFSFEKSITNILDSELDTARAKLKDVKAAALAEYLNLDDAIEKNSKSVSVLNWIANVGLAKPINRKDYQSFKVPALVKDKGISTEEAENIVKNEFASWTYKQQLGRGLHYVMGLVFNANYTLTTDKARQLLGQSWTKGFSRDATLEGVSDKALEEFISQMYNLKKQLIGDNTEKVYIEYVLNHDIDDNLSLIGKVDLITVSKDGVVHIYDLKISENKIEDWDIDRKKFLQFQLESYKRLLQSKGIDPRKIVTAAIPVELRIDKSGLSEENEKLIIKEGSEVIPSLVVHEPKPFSLSSNMQLMRMFNDKFPIQSGIKLNTSKIKSKVTDTLVKYFPVECLNGNRFKNLEKQSLIEKTKKDSKGNYRFYDPIDNKIVILESEKELNDYIDNYLENIEEKISNQVVNIKEVFKKVLDKANSRDGFVPINFTIPNVKNQEHQAYINTLFLKYTYEKGWRIVDNDDLIDMGIIMLVNDVNRKVDFISLTDTDLSAETKLSKGTTLLGSFYDDVSLETNDDILKATKGNIELIKLLEVADTILTEELKEYSIADLTVANLSQKQSMKPTSLDKIVANYNMLRNKIGKTKTSLVILDPLYRFYQAYNDIQKCAGSTYSAARLSNTINDKIKQIPAASTDLTPEERTSQIEQLYSLLQDLQVRFFYDGYKPDETLESALYAEIAKTIINLSGIEVDPYNTPKLAEWIGDIFKDGGLNRQLFNSTKLNTTDTVKLIQPIKRALDSTRYNIKARFFDYKMNTRDKYKKFKSGNGLTSNKFFNMSEIDYKNLFDTSENGKKYFLLKDPKSDETLTEHQREFLEFYLKDINSLRFPGQTEEALRANGQWLMAGIMKASTASRIANSTNIISAVSANITDDIFNRKHIVEESGIKSYTELNDREMMQMYNIFTSGNTLESRAKLIDRARKDKGGFDDPMTIFETNLELVADTMHLSYIRESEYNRILPAIQANLTILRLSSFIANDKEIDKTIDFISNHIKTTVFDESLISSENKQVYQLMSHVKRWASAAILGFNYKSGIKETIVSFFSLYTRAVANSTYGKDKIGIKDMTSAYMTVWKDAFSQIGVVTKLEALNMVYGISNMSEDELIQRMNYYQGDAFRFNANLFWFNRAPDYLNRMTLLVGYMKKYGCYDAYEFKDNKLIYDWRKDKRFDILAKYSNPNLVSESDKKQYNYQKALYNTMLERFVRQGYTINENGRERVITMKDELPHAFTDLEVASIKQEADSLFGYMDNDNKSELFKVSIFTMIGHFKTYLTAKKNQWFLTRDVYAGGHFTQARNDANELLYMKYSDNGKLQEITTEVTDTPYIKWEGAVTEGIFWSVLDLIYTPARAIFDKSYRSKAKAAWKDPIKKRNFIIASQELLLWWIIAQLLKLAFEDTKIGELTSAQRMFLGLARDTRNELNILQVMSGATQFSMPALDFAGNVYDDLSDAVDGKLNLGRVFINNFGVLKPLKYSLYEYFPNPEYKHTAVSDML